MPDNPVPPSRLFEIIVDSKRDLRTIIKAQHELYFGSSIETLLGKKLFGGPKNLFDILESTDIEILMDKPCHDSHGNKVDGSIYASIPNAICISPFSMGPKLIDERARVEVMALIVHELSHLLGTTEEEAVELQKDVAAQIKGIDDLATLFWVDEQSVQMSLVSRHLRKVIKNFDTLTYDEMNEILGKASLAGSFLKERHPEHFISLFDGREKDMHNFFDVGVLKLLRWYVTSQSDHSLKEDARQRYEKTFNGREEITYRDYATVHFDIDLDNFYGDAVIGRVKNKDDLLGQLKRLKQYYDELSEYFLKIKGNQALSQVYSPFPEVKENLWSLFEGDYLVTEKNCVENGLDVISPETGFTVKKRDDGKWTLVKKTKSGYGVMGVFNNAGDVWGGSTVKVFGSSNSATRTAEYGTSWNKEWKIKSYEIEKISDVLYKMKKSTVLQDRHRDSGIKEHSVECIYDLSPES